MQHKASRQISKKYWVAFVSLVAIMVVMSFKPLSEKHTITLHFANIVAGRKLILDTISYKNRLSQYYTVTNFKYYISNIRLIDDNGKVFENKNGYYLIREDEPDSKDIELTDVPMGNYKNISFTIGVDSLHNCSGAQSGALDPINGMFWTWNTGYIFFKLEGKSPASNQPGHIFEYHIGGYKEPANCIRTASIRLGQGQGGTPDTHEQNKTGNPDALLKIQDITIVVELANIFDSKTSIDISKLSSVTDFHNAPIVADNYQNMFFLGCLRYGYE